MERGLLDLHAVVTHSKSQKVKWGNLTSIYYVAHFTWHIWVGLIPLVKTVKYTVFDNDYSLYHKSQSCIHLE